MWFAASGNNRSAVARYVRFVGALLTYAVAVVVVIGLSAFGAVRIGEALAPSISRLLTAQIDGTDTSSGPAAPVSSKVLADERWNSAISSETFWKGRRSRPAPERSERRERDEESWWDRPDRPGRSGWFDDRSDDEDEEYSRPRGMGVYRTVCVRLCDGYYFPISFATTEDNLQRDVETCSNRCSGARLFYQRDIEDIDSMVDLSGEPYKKLKNAFLYRTKYDAACKCKPHPWEQASLTRHRRYALQERIRKADRTAVAELRALNEGATFKPDGSIGQPAPATAAPAVTPAAKPERPALAATTEALKKPTADATPHAQSQPEATSAAQTSPPTEAKPTSDRADVDEGEDVTSSGARSRRERSRFASRNSDSVMRLGGSNASGPSRKPSVPSRSGGSDWVQRAFHQH